MGKDQEIKITGSKIILVGGSKQINFFSNDLSDKNNCKKG